MHIWISVFVCNALNQVETKITEKLYIVFPLDTSFTRVNM